MIADLFDANRIPAEQGIALFAHFGYNLALDKRPALT
jgi:hypothetical protein